jgi:lysophospholipase L1-like esterase
MVRKWNKRRAPVFEKNLEFNLGMLEQLLERSRQRGVEVVLVELPRNEEIVAGRFDWALAMYQPRVRELAGRYGVPYVDFSQEIGLGNGDFHDLSHLVEPGRELWEQRLAEELAAFYERRGAAGTDSADEAEDTP